MKIAEINESNISIAGKIHSESWKESHKKICSAKFIEKHTPAAQTDYLRNEIKLGKKLYILTDEIIHVGIVSVFKNVIENLYVLPSYQRKGYGRKLLDYAVSLCSDTPKLWVLNVNKNALAFYNKYGFKDTGKRKHLLTGVYEIEMELITKQPPIEI